VSEWKFIKKAGEKMNFGFNFWENHDSELGEAGKFLKEGSPSLNFAC